MRVGLLGRDLIIASRVASAAAHAGVEFIRVEDAADLPSAAALRLLLVDWSERSPELGERLAAWRASAAETARPRIVLFGPHTDLAAHAEARASGLGPMWARSRLIASLSRLFA